MSRTEPEKPKADDANEYFTLASYRTAGAAAIAASEARPDSHTHGRPGSGPLDRGGMDGEGGRGDMHARPGWRASQRVTREERIILQALEAANVATGLAVTVAQAVGMATVAERRLLSALPARDLSTAVSKRLARLIRVGLVEEVGRVGGHAHYRVAGSAHAVLPQQQSRRQRTMALVEQTVAMLGRAARALDVVATFHTRAATGNGSAPEDADYISGDMQSLAWTGDLVVIGTARGGTGAGGNLYLPAALAAERARFLPKTPLSWQDYVAGVFDRVWDAHVREGAGAGRAPRPVSTAEVREALVAEAAAHTPYSGGGGVRSAMRAVPGAAVASTEPPAVSAKTWGKNLANPMTTVAVLLQLAQCDNAHIRKVANRTAVWAPANIADESVDLGKAFATDADRVAEAVRRALARSRLPAVSLEQVEREASLSPELRPAGKHPVAQVLSDAARATLAGGDGRRVERAERVVYRAGVVGGRSYYVAPGRRGGRAPLEEAKRYVAFRSTLLRIEEAGIHASVVVGNTPSPVITAGRARLLLAYSRRLLGEARVHESLPAEVTRGELSSVVARLEQEAAAIEGWLRFRAATLRELPADLDERVPCWTPAELLEALRPYSPTLANFESPLQASRLMSRVIRRLRNPQFVSRQSGDPQTSTEMLFDQADALRVAALRWGGVRAQHAANAMTTVVGELRDARYLIAALGRPDVDERLTAVAGLAFVRGADGLAALRARARTDERAGVREAALWAYGFAGGGDAMELVREAAEDADERVRQAAKRLAQHGQDCWWRA